MLDEFPSLLRTQLLQRTTPNGVKESLDCRFSRKIQSGVDGTWNIFLVRKIEHNHLL